MLNARRQVGKLRSRAQLLTRESRSLTTFAGQANWLAIHPEGKKLAVVVTGIDHTQRIVLRNLVDQTDSIIHQGAEYEHLRWSPDGSALAWNRPGPSINAPLISGGIWVIDVGQSEPRLLITKDIARYGTRKALRFTFRSAMDIKASGVITSTRERGTWFVIGIWCLTTMSSAAG